MWEMIEPFYLKINTLYILLPWMPRGSWSTAMIFLFCRMALYSGRIVRKSTDMSSGAARMAQMAIWVLLCSYDSPKLPMISWTEVKWWYNKYLGRLSCTSGYKLIDLLLQYFYFFYCLFYCVHFLYTWTVKNIYMVVQARNWWMYFIYWVNFVV